MYENSTTFVIIQSLRENEPSTGSDLYNDVLLPNAESNGWPRPRLYTPRSRDSFLKVLGDLEVETRAGQFEPSIQIETHGFSEQSREAADGLSLEDRNVVTWEELGSALTPINVACKNHLFLSMAACYGAHVARIVLPTERAPFAHLISALKKVYPDDIRDRFGQYYRCFLKDKDAHAALQHLLRPDPTRGQLFGYIQEGTVFRVLYQSFREKFEDPAFVRSWAERLAQDAIGRPEGDPIRLKAESLPLEERVSLYERRIREAEPISIRADAERYFMVDLYPENRPWFEKRFAEILRESTP